MKAIWVLEDKTYDDIAKQLGFRNGEYDFFDQGWEFRILKSLKEFDEKYFKIKDQIDTLIVFLDMRLSNWDEIKSDLTTTGGQSVINTLSHDNIKVYLFIWTSAQSIPSNLVSQFVKKNTGFSEIAHRTLLATSDLVDSIVFRDKNDTDLMKQLINRLTGVDFYKFDLKVDISEALGN